MSHGITKKLRTDGQGPTKGAGRGVGAGGSRSYNSHMATRGQQASRGLRFHLPAAVTRQEFPQGAEKKRGSVNWGCPGGEQKGGDRREEWKHISPELQVPWDLTSISSGGRGS